MGNVVSAVLMYALEVAWMFQRFLDQDYRQNHGSRVLPLPSEAEPSEVFLPNGASTPILSRSPHHHSKPSRVSGHQKTRSEPIAMLAPRPVRERTRRKSSSFRSRRKPEPQVPDTRTESNVCSQTQPSSSESTESEPTRASWAPSLDTKEWVRLHQGTKDWVQLHQNRTDWVQLHQDAEPPFPSSARSLRQTTDMTDHHLTSSDTTEWVSRHRPVAGGGVRRAFSDINLKTTPSLSATEEAVLRLVVSRGCASLDPSV